MSSHTRIGLHLLCLACAAGCDPADLAASEITPPDLAAPVIPCDGSVLERPLDLARDAHHELFVLEEHRVSLGEGAEWAAGPDFFADKVLLPEDLPDWLQPAWPPPEIAGVDTSTDTSTWSRVERWEPGWEDDHGNSGPGTWRHVGDVRFDEQGRETGYREEPLFSSQGPTWRWTAYGPAGWSWTEVRHDERGYSAYQQVQGLDGDTAAWRATRDFADEASLDGAALDEGGGQLFLVDGWGRNQYVRELAHPDGYRAEIRATSWFEHGGVAYRPLIQAAMANVLGGENHPYVSDGRYELNEGQTLVELGVIGTQRVTTSCMERTPAGVRREVLSHVVDDETGEISDVRLEIRIDGRPVGRGSDTDGDGVIDTASDRRVLDGGAIEEEFTWRLVDGERVEELTSRLVRDDAGRPLHRVSFWDGIEVDDTRWIHPE